MLVINCQTKEQIQSLSDCSTVRDFKEATTDHGAGLLLFGIVAL